MKVSNLIESVTALFEYVDVENFHDVEKSWRAGALSDEDYYAMKAEKDAIEKRWAREDRARQATSKQKYNLEIDGKLWKKDGVAVVFDSESHAKAVASKPWAKNKKIVLIPVK